MATLANCRTFADEDAQHSLRGSYRPESAVPIFAAERSIATEAAGPDDRKVRSLSLKLRPICSRARFFKTCHSLIQIYTSGIANIFSTRQRVSHSRSQFDGLEFLDRKVEEKFGTANLAEPVYAHFGGYISDTDLTPETLGDVARRQGVSAGPFAVSKDLVHQLDDVVLRTLLGKLLEAEAASRGVPMAAIDLGGNQNAPDGGIDAALSWQDGPAPGGWLPRRMTYFQCKAQALPPKAVEAEMRPSGSPRPIFERLTKEAGAYVIFSTDDIGANGINARLERMRAAIADVGDSDRIHLDFLGADRIARWVNQHLGVAMWLLAAAGRPLAGWRPWGDWSAAGSSALPYVIDETARAAVAGQEGDVLTAIAAMRGALASPGGTVRLVGLSGMGKTRLAEALFDTRVHGGKALAAATGIYGDTGLDLGVGAALVAEQLAMSGIEAVLIADNCTGRTHAQLAEIVGRKGSRTSLITIDYDIGDDQQTDTLIVKLDPNSEGVVLSLIEQRFPMLSESDRLHLARFSGGNARIALKVAERSTDGADLSKLGDAELLDRLFQTGRETADAAVRLVADTAALVYAFQTAADDRSRSAEHPALAGLAGMNANTFYRHVGTLLDWGIIQQRGIQRAVMPPPLANRLARPVVRRSDPSALLDAFAPHPRLMASFARRLGQLHDEPKAVELARQMMGPNGWLGLPVAFDADQKRAFRNLAPAAPEAALAAIERALSDDAAALDHDRSEYADLLAHIAYDDALFERAMTAMLALVLAEPPGNQDTQVRGLFLERFWPVLSRTMARGDTRIAFVDRLLDDDRDNVRALGVEALDHMMEVWHFSSSFMPEFGARARSREWQPRGRDYTAWIEAAFNRIERIATTDGPHRDRACRVVLEHLRSHLEGGNADRVLAAVRLIQPKDYWDEGWRAATDAMHFTRNTTGEWRNALAQLEHDLRPRTLEACFEAAVLGEPWRHWHPSGRENAPVREVGTFAKGIGRRVSRSGIDPTPFIARASLAGDINSVRDFGLGLARATGGMDDLWERAHSAYLALDADQRDAGLLVGIVQGSEPGHREWAEEKLNVIANDPILAPYLVFFHAGRALGTPDIDRFIAALDAGGITAERLGMLMMGGATKPIPAPDLARLLRRLSSEPEGAPQALQLLFMRFYGERETLPELAEVARALLADPACYTSERTRADHELADLARRMFGLANDVSLAVSICKALRIAYNASERWRSSRDFNELGKVMAEHHLRVVLTEIVSSDAEDELVETFLGDHLMEDIDGSERDRALDERVIAEWVAEDPQARALRLAEFVSYTTPAGEVAALGWSSVARMLITMAPEPVSVLQAFEERFFNGVSSGPFSLRFVRRRPLIEAMLTHGDPRIRRWARAAAERLQRQILYWDERDREGDSLFE